MAIPLLARGLVSFALRRKAGAVALGVRSYAAGRRHKQLGLSGTQSQTPIVPKIDTKFVLLNERAVKQSIDEVIKKLVNLDVAVGVIGGRYPSGITLAAVASVQEFGGSMNHPGGTLYYWASGAKAYPQDLRFYPNTDPNEFVLGDTGEPSKRTKPHPITVPERSFLRSTLRANRKKYVRMISKEVPEITRGRTTVQATLDAVGRVAKADVKKAIWDMDSPVNADSTVMHKGFNEPLMATGYLHSQITYRLGRPNVWQDRFTLIGKSPEHNW